MFLVTDFEPFLIPMLFIVIVGLILFITYYFSTKQKIIRALSKLPIKQIGSLKNNELTRFTGKALHVKEPLIAPFSKRKCVFYVIKIEQQKSNGKQQRWRTIVHEEKVQDFFLEKNSDFAMVRLHQNPKNYTSYLVADKKIKSGTFNDPTREFKALLESYHIKSDNFLGLNKTLRYSEAIIEIGEEITVAGIAKWKSLKEPIEGYSYSKIAELESSDKQKLIITDLPNIKSKKRF
ncbi:GIDE domain-containing protein [Polaribacter sp. AHE13PA]|uniref:GIDE domain-containing protein n=1 Tax=Polaribacter sp. AHE13PA TaxID=2745562 RepID=UPI001C4E3CEF|nr:GIDE domain-containing protein [Polaribacter sp. AHE13PA]QXP66212.1 hypothetical protein H0I28_13605 [Polaribacter sp. AHE13PA]